MNPDQQAPELISVGAQAVVANANRLGLTWQLRLARVTEGDDPFAVSALYDGDSTEIDMVSMIGALLPDTRVYVIQVPPAGNFIVGLITTAPVVGNEECTSVIGMSAGTTTSIAFATMPGTPTVSIVRANADSRIRIDLAGTFFSTAASAGLAAGVSIGTVGDFEVATVNAANSSLVAHTPYVGYLIVDPLTVSGGIPAGPYTVTGIWRRNGGVGTLNVDAGDMWACCVREIR